jgi:hypothetical protein
MFKLKKLREFHGNIEIINDSPSTSPLRFILDGWLKIPKFSSVSLEIVLNDKCYICYETKRPDVLNALGLPQEEVYGFQHEIFTYDYIPNIESFVFINIDNERHKIAAINLSDNRELSDYISNIGGREKCPNLLLITSLGRSGSSLLYKTLLESTELVGRDFFPYESHYFQKLAQILEFNIRCIGRRGNIPWDKINSSFTSLQLSQDNDPIENDMSESVIKLFLENFYASANNHFSFLKKMQNREYSKYICEKSTIGFPASLVSFLVPKFKEIILVRDIRDVIISSIGFAKKNKNSSFTNYESFNKISIEIEKYYNELFNRTKLPNTMVIKYEDIILQKQTVLRSISNFTEYDLKEIISDTKIEDHDIVSSHITTEKGKSTIGRWKTEYQDEISENYSTKLKELNNLFGYTD